MTKTSIRQVVCAVCLGGLMAGCSSRSAKQHANRVDDPTMSEGVASEVAHQSCATAAIAALGPGAEVLRCGSWSGAGSPQALVVLKLGSVPSSKGCAPVSRVMILSSGPTGWRTVLEASKEIRNPVGYIGLDFIDDSYKFLGYCLATADRRSDGSPGFSLFLTYLRSLSGETEGTSFEIGWNARVKRYQEFDGEFRPEVIDPPHRSPAAKSETR